MAKNTPKLTTDQREHRKTLKQILKDAGGAMFTYPERGIVVVIVPALHKRLDSKFVHFAISQCSESDNFRAKVGQLLALERWYNDQTMSRRADSGGNGLEMDLEVEADTIAWFFEKQVN